LEQNDRPLPGTWFKEKWAEWQTTLPMWKERQRLWRISRQKNGADEASAEKPPYSNFTCEDWALLCIRYEFHLLAHAYGKAVDVNLRPPIPQGLLLAICNEYFSKHLEVHSYGFKELRELAEEVKDTVEIQGEPGHIVPRLGGEDTDVGHFVKFVDVRRQERHRRIDAGDLSAVLKFVPGLLGPTGKICGDT
jgi:hypothetical protein